MDDNECNVLKARLIPQPREIHFSEGDVFLVQDACKVQIKLAVPDGVAEEATWLFKNHWNAQADIALETEPALASMGNDDYELEIGKRLLRIKAKGITGVRNAFKTLRQLAEVRRGTEKVSGHFLVPCTVRDEPALAFRGMHICIFPETQLWDIEKQVRLAAYHKFNYAIIETWGVFPFESHPEFGWQDRKISRGELKRLISLGKELGITLIPQFNLLGHATASRLMTGKHAVLDANPALQPLFEPDGWSWCLSNPNTRRILGDLVLELHDFYERPPFFHIGCDEAENLGTCLDCRRQDLKELVRGHIMWFHDLFRQRGTRVIMWHDMLLERGDQRWAGYVANGNKKLSGLVSELPKDIIIADWQYGYREGEGGSEPKWPTMDFFHQAGFNVLVCPWIEGKGIRSLGRKAELNGLMGMLETTWHISHDIYQTCIFGQAANAAWNPMAELPHWNSFVLSNALHMRQIGWDMGIAEYEKTGWNMEQVDPGRHPHHLR